MIISTKTGVLLTGTLGRDAEYKLVGSQQTPLLKFSVLYGHEDIEDVNGRRKGKYLDVDVWGAAADKLQGRLLKGDAILVAGTLNERCGEDGRIWRSIKTYGEVWPGAAWTFDQLGGASGAVAADTVDADGFIEVDKTEDLPF